MRRALGPVFNFALIALMAFVASPTLGAPETPDSGQTTSRRDTIEAQRSRLAERKVDLAARIAAAGEAEGLRTELSGELALVERIDRLHADQLAAIAEGEALIRSQESVERQLAAGPSQQVTGEPPYSLALLEGLWDALDAQNGRLGVLEAALGRTQEELDTARRRFDAQERKRREAKEAAGQSRAKDDEVEQARRRQALQLEELESQLASTRQELTELQMQNAERAVAIQRQAKALVRRAVSWVEERIAISPDDLEAPFERVAQARFDLGRALERAKQQLALADQRLAGVQGRIADGSVLDGTLASELAARQQEHQGALRGVEFLDRQRARLDIVEAWWGHRLRVLSGDATNVELRTWKEELAAQLDEWETRQRLERSRLAELADEQVSLRARLASAREAKSTEMRWLGEQLAQLDALVALYSEEIGHVEQSARLLDRTRREIKHQETGLTLAERMQWLASRIRHVWSTELTSVDDRPISVGKILTALTLLFAGYWLSRRLSSGIGGTLRKRARLDAGASAAFQSLSFYLLLLAFLLVALDTANIPLTVFTLAGGAVAIGIGFGSQNIVNNFISGLILLVERPIKVGDLVEVEGTQGYVDQIGARSTVVRTFDNINIIMPNSTFLETNVVNWTLSDHLVRSRVEVGVAYGSPVREVEQLLQDAMAAQQEIREQPEPFVRFLDFGDSALLFGAYFWLTLGPRSDRLRVQSELRFEIDRLFHEAGVEIAFPQRDLHLRSAIPMRVEVVEPPTA